MTSLVLSFFLQLTGFYLLYAASSRVVYVKRKWDSWLYRHRFFSKIAGWLMLLISTILFLTEFGIGTGFFFALVSFTTVSGLIIMLIPLQKA